MLTNEKKQLIQESLRSLAATHAAAVAQIEETMRVLVLALDLDASDDGGPGTANRPIVDEATFSVTWRGRTCFLGNTLLYWLFARLARSTNRYVAQLDLLDDVWRGERHASTIRGVAKRLRDRLRAAGMADLAKAIDGSVSGYYGLILV
jgi:DNA-binding response OmpR family regulator